MTTENQQPATGDATGQPQGEQNGGTGTATGATTTSAPAVQPAVTFATEADFQRRVDDMLRERLERERVKAEKAAAKAREDAQAEAAAKNGEWQQLAETRAAKIAEMEAQLAGLDATTARAQRFEAALAQQVGALRKDLPKHLAPLLDKLDVVEQLEWLAANRQELAAKLSGVPPTPRAQGSTDAAALEQARAQSASFYNDF